MGQSAVIALLFGAQTAQQVEAQRDQKAAARYQYQLGLQKQAEEKASNASEAALERRRQIREERVKRARILQSAENTGVEGSSGELGAIGSLATTLSANLGTNLGRITSANRVSGINQGLADAQFGMQKAQLKGEQAQMISNFGKSIFGS
jgi:hypothetical protein